MNLVRDKAIEAMDLLTNHGYDVALTAIPQTRFQVPGHEGPLYRIEVPALTHETHNLRELCDLAESIGLTCRYMLEAIRFEPIDRALQAPEQVGLA